MSYSLTFNGVKKPYITLGIGKRRSAFAPLTRNLLKMPGMAGAYLESTDTDIRVIQQPINIEGKDRYDLRKLEEEIALWLITKEPAELIFDDEPDRVYYAVVDGSLDIEDIVNFGQGTITFICPDPYKYGVEKPVKGATSASFINNGTVESEPIIRCEIKQDTTFVVVSNGEELNIIGNYGQVDELPYEPETRVLWDQMGAITGWSPSTSVEEGISVGTMKSNGHEFYTDDYGGGGGWHGPAIKKSIGQTLQDFKIDVLMSQLGVTGQVGSIEVALLDSNNQFVAKLLLTKRSANNPAVYATLRAGKYDSGNDVMSSRGANDTTWANFDGILRLIRKGNQWAAYVSKIDSNGNHHTSLYRAWNDTEGIAIAPITQVQVQLWQYASVSPTNQRVKDIKVFKINEQSTGIPYVARVGDVIEFDHKNDNILRNGESIIKDKMFVGKYFSIKPGLSTITVEPAEAIESTEVRWREKWR
ncbi:distal tail protein Dit [Fredinandcohnia sp. 179-A 10B2 NHS]|uniref:distal tail protein Dit n=1 Tax=Fredinandcohnia sp. 179-A 10B2 NHS TaxID=3235176 RepID=UPI0039A1A2AC